MKINSPAENRITVDLTEQDMAELDITYEEMDYSTIETRRVIWTLLDEAGKALGKELDPSRRMIIEAIPKNEGGCVLNFTLLDAAKRINTQKQLLKKQTKSLICEFDTADCLFRAAKHYTGCTESSLYERRGNYRLVIKGLCDPVASVRHFSEFGKIINCEPLICEHMKEHWNTLAEKDALDRLRL